MLVHGVDPSPNPRPRSSPNPNLDDLGGGAQGKGIFLFNKLSQIADWKKDHRWKADNPQAETYVVQRYLEHSNPNPNPNPNPKPDPNPNPRRRRLRRDWLR